MIDEEYKWVYSYTLPCTRRGDERIFRKLLKSGEFVSFLKGNYSRENVRNYFLVNHNLRELTDLRLMNREHFSSGYLHLALPYEIKEAGEGLLACKLVEPFDQMFLEKDKKFSPFEIKSAEERGIFDASSEIVIAHAGIISETCKKEDIIEHIHKFEQKMATAA